MNIPPPLYKADLSPYPHITKLLTPDQQNTLSSALNIILHHRAVLLYEMTGSGKTFVASALAAILQATENAECFVVAPAHLLQVWKNVAARFQLKASYYSYQAASLHSIPEPQNDDAIWLLDEAHTLKNRNTKRFAELQYLTSRHRVCLITATPVSMGWQDLQSILTICGMPQMDFGNDKAWLQAFTRAIVPQTNATPLTTDACISADRQFLNYSTQPTERLKTFMSELEQIQWMTLNQNQILDEIRLLPLVLMHRFLSHPASCLITLQKLERYYAAARLHSSQKMLSRKEFHQLMGIEGTQQLLPFENITYGNNISPFQKEKLDLELAHIKAATRTLQCMLKEYDDKIDQLKTFITSNPQNKFIIFTQYADTANYLAKHLKCPTPIALLTADKAEYNGHKIDPEIVMTMFDPFASLPAWWNKTSLEPAQILICSDAFSCGHNLQNANVLIHFDLPWNPTTLHQREGRMIRKGQKNTSVTIVEMKHAQTCPQLQTYQTLLETRLNTRKKLQTNWFSRVSPLHANEFLFCNALGIPHFWALYNQTWIPICPDEVEIIPDNAQITQITLAEAFSESIQRLKPTCQPLWNRLKWVKNSPQISEALKCLIHITYQCAFFPQFVQYYRSHFETLAENLPHFLNKIKKLPVKSVPPPNTPCWKITIYPQLCHTFPQIPHTFPQLIHKLSTDSVRILSPKLT